MTTLQQEGSTLQSVEQAGAGESTFSASKEEVSEQKTLPCLERYGEGDILTPGDHFQSKLVAVQYDQSGTIKMSVDHLPLHQTMPVHYMASPCVPQLNLGNRVYNRKYSEMTPRMSSPSTPSMRMTYYQTPRQPRTKEDLFISELDQRINKLQNTMKDLKKEMKDDRHMKRDARNHYKQKYMPWISSWRSTGSTPSLKLTNYATPKTYDWLPSPTDEPLPLIPKLPPRNPNTKPLIEGLPISPSPEDIFAQDEILQNRPKFSADVFKRKLYELEELCQNELVRIESTAQTLKKKSSDPCNYWPQSSFNKSFMENNNQSGSFLLETDPAEISHSRTPKEMFQNFENNQYSNLHCLAEELNNISNNNQPFSAKIPHEIYNNNSLPATRDPVLVSKSFLEGVSATDSELEKNDMKSIYSKNISLNTEISKKNTIGLDEASINQEINWETSAERFRQILNSRDDVDLNMASEPVSDLEKNNLKSIYSKQISLNTDISKRSSLQLDEDSINRKVDWETSAERFRQILNSRDDVDLNMTSEPVSDLEKNNLKSIYSKQISLKSDISKRSSLQSDEDSINREIAWETSAEKLKQILNTRDHVNFIYPSTTRTDITMVNMSNQKISNYNLKNKIVDNLKGNIEPSRTAKEEVQNLQRHEKLSSNSDENKKNENENNMNITKNSDSSREADQKIRGNAKKENSQELEKNQRVFLEDLSEKYYSNSNLRSIYDSDDSCKSNSSSSNYIDEFDSRPKKHISRREKSRYPETNSDKPTNSKSKLYHSSKFANSSSDSEDSFKNSSNSSSPSSS